MIDSFLSERSIFLGTLFLREIFLIPSVVGVAARGMPFVSIWGAGVLGLIVNDLFWFYLIRQEPERLVGLIREQEKSRLPWRVRTWLGLLMVSSLLVGSRLLVYWQMVRRKVGWLLALGTIVMADVIWGTVVVGLSWGLGKKFLVFFEHYRPLALVVLIVVLIILVGRRLLSRFADQVGE